MPEREISLQEAATQRGLELRTLQAAAKTGKLRARKVAGVWLVRGKEVDRWVAAAEHRPGPRPRRRAAGEAVPATSVASAGAAEKASAMSCCPASASVGASVDRTQ